VHTIPKLLLIVVACAALVAVSGCSGRRSAVHVQLCVEDEAGIEELRVILRDAASEAGLKFIDYSKERPSELKATGASLAFLEKPEHYFEVWGDAGRGAGFSAGNLGLSSFEVSIGFGGGGEEQAEAKELAQKVISEISKHWPVTLVPPNRGALPTGRCPSSEVKRDESPQGAA